MKRLVVCADGTWNTPDQQDQGQPAPTNVWKMYEAVRRASTAPDGVTQMAHYEPGVGAYPKGLPGLLMRARMLFTRKNRQGSIYQGMTGDGLDDIVMSCYGWLVKHYEPGDAIYVFGYSRGAFTVRSLAGLIRKCGIVRPGGRATVRTAFAYYRNDIPPADPRAVRFRTEHAREATVKCIGVWDTVGALGIPLGTFTNMNAARHQFHDVTLSSHVEHAYHALAIDEMRKPFAPTLWEQQPNANQTLEQAWFAGVHSNVGGGYSDCGLSDNAFLWMAERAKRAGLVLDEEYVRKEICRGKWDGELRDSMAPPYTALGPYSRPIARERIVKGVRIDTRETVHDTAQQRFGKIVLPATSPYAPANLVEYLQRMSRPTASRPESALRSPELR
jgi:uncharacterized protein (DUF2235 family)